MKVGSINVIVVTGLRRGAALEPGDLLAPSLSLTMFRLLLLGNAHTNSWRASSWLLLICSPDKLTLKNTYMNPNPACSAQTSLLSRFFGQINIAKRRSTFKHVPTSPLLFLHPPSLSPDKLTQEDKHLCPPAPSPPPQINFMNVEDVHINPPLSFISHSSRLYSPSP